MVMIMITSIIFIDALAETKSRLPASIGFSDHNRGETATSSREREQPQSRVPANRFFVCRIAISRPITIQQRRNESNSFEISYRLSI